MKFETIFFGGNNMKKFRLIALEIVCILSMACFFACKGGEDSSTSSSSEPVEAGHVCEFSDWEVIAEATCAAAGSQQRVCIAEGCDAGVDGAPAVQTQTIPALPHTLGEAVVVESTCAVPGTSTQTCSVCGAEEVTELPLAEHTWGEWQHDAESGVTTCAYAAKNVRVCDVCEAKEYQYQELAEHTLVNGVCSVCGYDPSKSYTYKTYTSVLPLTGTN